MPDLPFPPPSSEEPHLSEKSAHAFSLNQRNPRFIYKANPRDRVMAIFRVIIWMSPGPAIIAIGILFEFLYQWIPRPSDYVYFLLILIGVIAIGYLDAYLSPNIEKTDGRPNSDAAIRHAVGFTLAQIIIAPLSLTFMMIIAFAVASLFQ